jgi:dihydroorotate dehydrogenase
MKVITKNGYTFKNVVGLGPGFDQTGCAIDGIFEMNLGFIEIGSVTVE